MPTLNSHIPRLIYALATGLYYFLGIYYFGTLTDIFAAEPLPLIFSLPAGMLAGTAAFLFFLQFRFPPLQTKKPARAISFALIYLLVFVFLVFLWAIYLSIAEAWTAVGLRVGVDLFYLSLLPMILLMWFLQKPNKMAKPSGDPARVPETVSGELTNENPTALITLEAGKEKLSFTPSDFLLGEAADNYIRIYFISGGTVDSMLLRMKMKQLEKEMQNFEFMFRCHRSYLINARKITGISGKSQSQALHLKDLEIPVPVSRSFNTDLLGPYLP